MAQIAENDILRALLKSRDVSGGGVQDASISRPSADPSRDASGAKLRRRVQEQLGDEPSFDQPFPQVPEFLRRARELNVGDEPVGLQEALEMVLTDRVQRRSATEGRRPDNYRSVVEEAEEAEAEHTDQLVEALLSGGAARARRDAARVYQ